MLPLPEQIADRIDHRIQENKIEKICKNHTYHKVLASRQRW
jgi:hypothetical protein